MSEKKQGIVCLRNLKTDRVYLFYSEDIENDCIKMRFDLDLGLHSCAELQRDYEQTGLEVFRFDTLEETKDKRRLEYFKEINKLKY